MNTLFFSIIIPSYNRAHMLSKAIESVIGQTFKEWELIVVDDGSTDNTRDLVYTYNDKRIKYIYQKNSERSAARNNGINNAKGIYITFLDSDDYYLPDRLENLHQEIHIRNQPVAFFYTGICFENNGVITERKELPNIYKSFKDYLLINVIGSPQVCMHRNILNKNNFNEKISISEDSELWLRIENAGHPFIFLNHFDIVATNHFERSVNAEINNSYGRMLPVLDYIFSKPHPGNEISTGMKRLVKSSVYYGIARHYIYNHKKNKAVFNLLYSILLIPLNLRTKHKIYLIFKLLITKKRNLPEIKKYIG